MAENEMDEHMAEAMNEDIKKLIGMYGVENVQKVLAQQKSEATVTKLTEEQRGEASSVDEEKNKARLAIFRDLRNSLGKYGFDELRAPGYENPNDRSSDVTLFVDTHTCGRLDLHVDINGNVTFITISDRPDFLNELSELREGILSKNPNIQINAKFRDDHGGTELNITDIKNIPADYSNSPPPKPIDPSRENYSHDARTGNWHVSPK